MEGAGILRDTLLLLDNFGNDSRNLMQSFEQAGFKGAVMVIEDDGFLPDNIITAARFFKSKCNDNNRGKPRYFNQIDVPDYWEISGTGIEGKVHNLNKERGKIIYHGEKSKRIVSHVEWYNEEGIIRDIDHYDKNGVMWAHTSFSKDGKRFCKSTFDSDGREILVENYLTGDIILNWNNKIYIFKNKTQLILKMLEMMGMQYSRVIFNSLSTPFFVSEQLPENGREDILIWQEGPRDDVPGNMLGILNGTSRRADIVLVQNTSSYDNLIKNGANERKLSLLGNIYKFKRNNKKSNEILICTNSDQIEHLETIVSSLPEMHFNIAAVTEMSSKLMSMERYENVSCFPTVKQKTVDELFLKSDYYLDINTGSEILNAVKSAFLYNQLILGFSSTMHNAYYVDFSHRFNVNECNKLIELVKMCYSDEGILNNHLDIQRKFALSESIDNYKTIFNI